MVDWARAVAHNTARNQGDARVLTFGKNNIGQLAAIAAASRPVSFAWL